MTRQVSVGLLNQFYRASLFKDWHLQMLVEHRVPQCGLKKVLFAELKITHGAGGWEGVFGSPGSSANLG